MTTHPPIHLDHAATSWPKAPGVVDAMARWYDELGVSADRGDSEASRSVADAVDAVRSKLARRLGMSPARCAFTSGATESINLFLRGFLRPGDRVVTTAIEHSALARPLVALCSEAGIGTVTVECDGAGAVDAQHVVEASRSTRPRLIALSHASNVTGAIVDVAPIVAAARELEARVLLDASQTVGAIDVDLGADAIAGSAHKSLLGPPGLGFLAVRDGLEITPHKLGGTGSARPSDAQPPHWPAAFEAGTPNTPAILGLGAALDWLAAHDAAAARRRALEAIDELRAALRRRPGVRCLGPEHGDLRLPILSFTADDLDPAEIGALCDLAGLRVRSGFHCAPWIHRALGTEAMGTVRVSPGPFVTADEVLRVASVLVRA
ncbi:MAG: aminotransferase class V-fold PLP-dependent enzyme [Planctomycetes bacterium]|nr:aminotransferase class V-fold PLP-dependent enzyme [Planctomycetota bacterium]